MATQRGCWDVIPGEQRSRAAPSGSPPVLTLSHFCAKPFLCFGDVRLGATRTLPLALFNPNAEPAVVTVPRGAAAATAAGFRVSPRAFELQPEEKIVISVNWTPQKEGRVREIVTFLVNDILKHEVILLGNSEEPRKKKNSLWDTIKKKKVSNSSSREKRISNVQKVNKTFSVPQKGDRVRSPLQACENLGSDEGCSPTENNSLILKENKMPISPISSTSKEWHGETCLPLCVRRSTTYTSLHPPGHGELWNFEGSSISQDFHEGVITETSFNSENSVNGLIEEDNKLTFTPNCSSTLNITQSQGNFLSPDSFVKNSQAANNELDSLMCVSSDTYLMDNLRPVHLESQTVCEIYQTILSPDTFIKDNYGLNQELESKLMNPILSPNQFINDNMTHTSISRHPCKLSPLSLECQGANSPKAIFQEPKALEMKPNGCSFTKQNQPKILAVQDISGNNLNTLLKRRPILSTTVTKLKPTTTRENRTETSKPKARRHLRSVAGEGEKGTVDAEEKDALHSFLPVIDPVESKSKGCKRIVSPSSNSSMARKRKSEGNREDANVTAAAEHSEAQEIKRIHFSPAELKTNAKKTKTGVTLPVSKHTGNREKLNLKKRTDALAYKTPNSKTNKRTKRIVPVAQSNLTFIRPLKTDIPRHPMPFAAKNMFYDERWKEKQQQGFTWWLNFILTPDDFTVKTEVSEVNAATVLGVESQHKLSVPRAPTKDEASLRAYMARCRLNRLRRAACRLFTSEKMVKAIKKLEVEIEARRLIVRKDRHLWKDVGERQKVLTWLLSYNPLWLRIGLETVYGELITLEDNSDVTGMAVFILNRLLWNPDIAAEYRHPSVPHLYKDGHEEALSKFTLKKLLLLVCFLDYAKVSRLIDHDPCLFCKDAEFKTSKEILLAFSRDFLSGEGDLSRHLSLLGLPVTHVQTPLDEFDFAVTNLAVDLQCGVRLVRTMELLTRNWDLSKKLRIPAISRLQKMHNVDIVLEVLKSRGVLLTDEHGGAILSKDIVDRHREKTLALLWKIVLAFQVDIALDLDQLKEEIDLLKCMWRKKKATSAPVGLAAPLRRKEGPGSRGSCGPPDKSLPLLLEWVRAVCAFYSQRVENFTVSFSDGRVLCYLIHHYYPCYVPLDAIRQWTTQTMECAQTGSVVLNSSSESDDGCLDVSLKAPDPAGPAATHIELLENERQNFQLVRSAVRDLGGIPAMIHHADMSNTIPDEKVVVTFLSCLCARLLDLRRETHAARLIQMAWRQHRLRAEQRRYQERDKAARIIQSAVVSFLRERRQEMEAQAAVLIQKQWRRLLQQRKLLMVKKERLEKVQNKSVLVIQRHWRRYSTRKRFLELRACTVVLQAWIRMRIAAAAYQRCRWAAATIQRCWRARMAGQRDRWIYKRLRSACCHIQAGFRRWQRRQLQRQVQATRTLQRAFRSWHSRRHTKRERCAAAIQAWYRMHRELWRYRRIRACVIVVQARVRGMLAQRAYRRKQEAVLTLQRRWRAQLQGAQARSLYLQTRTAAVCLQAAARALHARHMRKRLWAAHVCQSCWRMRRDRLRFLSLRGFVIWVQARVRRHQQLQKYKKVKKATLVIQIHFRAYMLAKEARASYQKTRRAVIVLQSSCRGMQARKRFHHTLTSVIKIQSYYRAYISRKQFLSLKHAAIRLQSMVRMRQTREQYLCVRAAVLFVQRRHRSLQVVAATRAEYTQVQASCVRLQAWVRGYLVRKQVRLQRTAAVSLQSYFRMRRARRDYLGLRRVALVIQSHYRAHRVWVMQRQDLQAQRAATRLQAVYRGHRVRQSLQQRSRAARRIQATFQSYRERQKHQSVLRATVRIQRWFRACRMACDLRARFLRTRRAAVSLQAAYRGWRIREMLRREHQVATKIQAAFRMAKAKKQYRSLRRAALLLQWRWRARAAGRKQRVEYAELRCAALTLQAAWKGRTARRRMQKRLECASVIQSYYRMYAQRKKWKAMRQAVRLLQVHYRACSLGRSQQLLYWKTQAAAVTLQAAYRGMQTRRKLQECRRAVVTIQSAFRAYSTRKRSAAHRASAVTIQRWYQNVQMANRQRQEYLTLKTAATQIQAVYRGLRVRRHVQQLHVAATLIQAAFRMHQSKVRYHKVRTAAVVIQARYRAYRRGKVQRAWYLAVLKAVSTLQAGLRGARVRQVLRERRAAATRIQACYRRYREQAYFAKLKKAAEAVQHKFRAVTARNVHVQRYQKLRRAVIWIQAVFRGTRARRHVKAMHAAAALIQRRFRTLLLRRRFLALRTTAVWVQRRYRANVHTKQHLEFLCLQKVTTQIQSLFRSWLVKKRVQEMHMAATVIQATFRMHREQVRYQTLRHAVVLVQQRFRACRASQLQREQHVRQGCAAAAIQAAYQAGRARRLSLGKRRAAVPTQSAHRRHTQQVLHRRVPGVAELTQGKYSASEGQARQHSAPVEVDSQDRTTGERSQQHRAAIVVQKHFKAVTTRRRYLHLRATAVSVQRQYKALAAAHAHAALHPQSRSRGASPPSGTRSGHLAATLIQARDRTCRTRAALQTETRAAVVQNYDGSCVKATAGRGQVLAIQESVQTLGAAGRGVAVRPELGNRCGGKMAAVADLPASCGDGPGTQHPSAQSPVVRHPRGSKALPVTGVQAAECHSQSVAVGMVPKASQKVAIGTLETQAYAALRIQTFLQMAACRRRFRQQRRAAVTLQRAFRARLARRRFLLLRGAALVVQSHYRARAWAKRQRQVYLQTRSSVIVIQVRMRGFLQKRKFQRIKDSIVTIQAAWRRYRARKYACAVKAACRIQAWYRGWRVRREYLSVLALLRAVHIIQRCFYCRLERARFLKVRASAVIIQRRWRATLSGRTAHEHFLMMKISERSASVRLLRFTAAARGHLAALRIQRVYRRHLAMRKALKHVRSVICIQRWFRARLQLRRFGRFCLRIMDIQQEVQERVRQARAAAVLQRAVRRLLLRRRHEKLSRGVAKFQALWRGYWWRKKHDSMKMRAIRTSLQALSDEAREQDKLCTRMALALHHLLTYRHLSAILEALRHLEVVTRLSPLCCENMAQSGAISKIFVLIRSCNRSVPCMEVISYAVQVLLNVAKYEKTTPAVYEVDSCLSTLLELLQMYREKPGDKVANKSGNIFTRTCCLLAVLLKATNRASSDVRNRSKVVNCVYSIYKLTAHKHRINTERILHSQNKNSSISIPFIPETPVRTKMVSRLKPDWVLRRDNTEEIINPLQAIQMVMDTLGIPY